MRENEGKKCYRRRETEEKSEPPLLSAARARYAPVVPLLLENPVRIWCWCDDSRWFWMIPVRICWFCDDLSWFWVNPVRICWFCEDLFLVFLENFLVIFCFGSNWFWREKEISVFVMWLILIFLFGSDTSIYSLPCVFVGQWENAIWTETEVCENSGQKCPWDLFCKKNNKKGLENESKDWNEIKNCLDKKCNFGTSIEGPKCN